MRLVIAEKPSVAQSIAAVLGAKSRHDGYEHMTELADDGETILVPGEKSRNTEEVEAESISYAVCQYYGIETGENSFGYIATWSKGKELKELRASLETINKTASELITDIDRHFAQICKERGINREEVSATQTDEALYLVDDSVYLHVQHTDGGWDYSLYDKESKKLLDGGVIDSSAIEDSPVASVTGAVRTEVFAIQGMTPTKVTFADMEVLENLQETQITPPLGSEQITGAVVVPTDAADTMLPELEQATPMPDPTLTVDAMHSYDRAFHILAITVCQADWDRRYSPDNRAWANAMSIPANPDAWGTDRNCYLAVSSHPGLVDLFLSQTRKAYAQEQQKTSVRDMLKKLPETTSPKISAKSKSPER